MSSREIAIMVLLALAMVGVAVSMGSWVQSAYPGQFELHEPEAENATDSESARNLNSTASSTAFGYGAATGLLVVSLLYCLLVAGLLVRCKVKNIRRGPLTTGIAVLAACGFALSYFVDGYFF